MLMLQLAASVVALALSAGEVAGLTEQEARVFFADYIDKSRSSDPGEADFYCDNGKVQMLREDASGKVTSITGPASTFKQIVRESAAEGKTTGDYSDFSEVTYRSEGESIRIAAVRYSALGRYESPATFVVGRCDSGDIGILELVFYSKAARQ